MASQWAREKAAQAWCTNDTSQFVMNVALAEAFAEILDNALVLRLHEDITYAHNMYIKLYNSMRDEGCDEFVARTAVKVFMKLAFDFDTSNFE